VEKEVTKLLGTRRGGQSPGKVAGSVTRSDWCRKSSSPFVAVNVRGGKTWGGRIHVVEKSSQGGIFHLGGIPSRQKPFYQTITLGERASKKQGRKTVKRGFEHWRGSTKTNQEGELPGGKRDGFPPRNGKGPSKALLLGGNRRQWGGGG